MNAIVSTNLNDVRPDRLPPTRREGPARLLFLSTTRFGFRNYHNKIIHYADQRDDVQAVHIDLREPLWLKVLGKSIPHVGEHGWDLHSYRYMRLWGSLINRWLRGPLRLDHFDLVHVIGQSNARSIPRLQRRYPVGFAVNIDRTEIDLVEHFGYSSLALRPMLAAERRIILASDLVVCRNRRAVRSMQEQFSLPDDRVLLARNSMKPTPVSRLDRPPRAPGELPRIVFVGNWFHRKHGPQLVAHHQQVWRDRAELHIISRDARPDASAHNVIWHGAQPRERILDELLPDMDIFVLPTTHDLHPWAILEAASVGLPVVSTRLFGIPEMVIDGETGLLHDPGSWEQFDQAIERLVSEPELRFQFGRAAREHVRANYDPDQTYHGLLDRLVYLSDPANRSRRAEPAPTST
jgi:glycosyltransferase involved in cell wall biosynthesis